MGSEERDEAAESEDDELDRASAEDVADAEEAMDEEEDIRAEIEGEGPVGPKDAAAMGAGDEEELDGARAEGEDEGLAEASWFAGGAGGRGAGGWRRSRTASSCRSQKGQLDLQLGEMRLEMQTKQRRRLM